MRFRGLLVIGMILFSLHAALAAGLPLPEAPVGYDIAGCGVVVSAAPLAAALGGTVGPTGEVDEYAFTVGTSKVVMKLNSMNATEDGKAVKLAPAPFSVPELKDELYLPLIPIIEALGGKVKRDKSPIAVITLPGQPCPLEIAVSQAGGKDPDGNLFPAGEVLIEIAERVDKYGHLSVMHADGSGLTRFTTGSMDCALPSYSKSGDRWISLRTLVEDFYSSSLLSRRGPKNATSHFTQLDPFKLVTFGKADDITGALITGVDLSPDGATILLTVVTMFEGKDTPVISIFAMPFEGGKARLLMANAGEPCWSPDSKRVACVSAIDGMVVVINAAGKAEKVEIGKGSGPVFSHNGKHLLFRQQSPDDVSIFAVAHFGDKNITLSELPADKRAANEEGAAFTPDDSAIIIARRGDGLLRVNLDRTDEKPITSEGFDSSPTISPDGEWLYFLRGGELHRMKIGGGPATKLTDGQPLRGYAIAPDGETVWVLRTEK